MKLIASGVGISKVLLGQEKFYNIFTFIYYYASSVKENSSPPSLCFVKATTIIKYFCKVNQQVS